MRKRAKAHANQTEALITIAAGINDVARAHAVLGTNDGDPFLLVARDILAGTLDAISPDWRERLMAMVGRSWQDLTLWEQTGAAASRLRAIGAGLTDQRRLSDSQQRWLGAALENTAKAAAVLQHASGSGKD